ncbi:nickel-type superoxide dismutase maturation protease [Prochlorococcus marinus]|uniref:nickel-type superoxide dismutase maturation protease n=1 Tax=Prochlorococcus marinus TaxID=1219 RepID=UPI0022B36012|nr:nickel-type superoxide dismutase maturation protease [Prochlorococcus marinus]
MIAGLPQADKSPLHKPDLFTLFTLIIGYRQYLRVVGSSMERTLKEGDLVTYKKLNQKNIKLEIGDIVVASHPKIKNKLIIKRIYSIYQNKFDLRGDNSLASTDSRELGLIELDLIIGKVDKIFSK